MSTPVTVVAHGRPATAALARAVTSAKGADPLAKVTVLVPSNLAGLSARRLLGSDAFGQGGVANVDFVTLFRLAELLAPVRTPGRKPLTNPVLAAAVRQVLATEPGRFASVAAHDATEAALVALYAELSRTLPATREAMAAVDGHGRALVEIHRRIEAALSDHEGEDDLLQMACEHLEQDPALTERLGALIWWLPEPMPPAGSALVRALLGRLESTAGAQIVVALTGERDPDDLVLGACKAVGVQVEVPTIEPCRADRVLSVSDADEEVRAVVRSILALLAEGVPLHRIGVFHPHPDPYARTLHEQFAAAGIAHNGPSRRRLSDLMAGRVLLGSLGVVDAELARAPVLALCATGPVRDDEGYVPAGRWERISRQAGVVGGHDDWHSKLEAFTDSVRDRIAGARDPSESRRAWAESEVASAGRLLRFVDHLDELVGAIHRASTWADKSAAAVRLVADLLGPEHQRLHWSDQERDAAERIDETLSRLSVLDEIEPDPTDESFRRAILGELGSTVGRIGHFGSGVLFGPLASAVGQDLDAVFVVGMAEGSSPAPRAEDPLLNDRLRSCAVAGELGSRADDLAMQHRAFAAAVASAPTGTDDRPRRTLVFPRGDLRSNRTRIPSRWLLPTVSAMAGERVTTAAFSRLEVDGVVEIASYAAGLLDGRPAPDASEYETAEVYRHLIAGGDPFAHPVVIGPVARGLDASASRDAQRFTEWDGDLRGADLELPGTSRPASATRLERWASCPFRYFLADVLGLGDRDDPDEIVEIDPRDRGSLLHRVLEEFVGWSIRRRLGGPPSPDEPWHHDDHAVLHSIADRIMDTYETEGRTGRALTWKLERARLHRELGAWIIDDDQTRAELGTTPLEVEMEFGFEEPFTLEVGGHRLGFHGMIDRVDRTESDDLVVYDYKSGRPDFYKTLAEDPVRAGRTLQLGLYAEAARARHGPAGVDAKYWMMTERGGNTKVGYSWTPERRERFDSVVSSIVDGIDQGAFPASPGEYDPYWQSHETCRFCDFDAVCPKDRSDHARATAADPLVAELFLRLEPPDDQDGTT